MTDVPMSFERLKAFLGYEQPKAIMRWLDDNGIHYKIANKKPVTSMSAINKALLGDDDDDKIEFEM